MKKKCIRLEIRLADEEAQMFQSKTKTHRLQLTTLNLCR